MSIKGLLLDLDGTLYVGEPELPPLAYVEKHETFAPVESRLELAWRHVLVAGPSQGT